MKKYGLALLILFLLMGAPAAHAATIYTDSSIGNDSTGNGSSISPYATLTKAYTAASSGDTINVSGIFTWSNAAETTASTTSGFIFNKNITIQGQDQSTTILEASTTPNTTTRSVLTVSSSVTVTLKNLTVQNGHNVIAYTGAGITNNGTLSLQNVTVTNNSQNIGTSYFGAAGIFTASATNLTISTSTISNNSFTGRLYGAGGVFAQNSNTAVVITASTISGNSSVTDIPTAYPYSYADPAGGVTALQGSLTLTNSTISGNSSNSYAGGMNLYNGGAMIITNSTIANNTASQGAGGILAAFSGTTLYMKNNIVANNIGNTAEDDFYAVDTASGGYTIDNGYNIVGSSTNKTWSATGDLTTLTNLNLSALLAVNGATNGLQTLALSAGSSAINAGDAVTSNQGVAVPTFDQRGTSRSGLTDIGSYEYVAIVIPAGATNNAHSVPMKPILSLDSITDSSVTVSGGSIELNGITDVGVVYGTSSTTLIHKDFSVSGTLQYSLPLSELTCGTRYQVAPYSVNSYGTTLGDTEYFTTKSCVVSTVSPALTPQLSVAVPISTSAKAIAVTAVVQGASFGRNLHKGMSGTDVLSLQHFLNTHGFPVALSGSGSLGNETNYFGAATKTALSKYQISVGILPAVGYFGLTTRTKINSEPTN